MPSEDQTEHSGLGLAFDLIVRCLVVLGIGFLAYYVYVVQRTSGIPFGAGNWRLILVSSAVALGIAFAASCLLVLLAWNGRDLYRRYWHRDLGTPLQIVKKCWSCGYKRSQDREVPCSECGAPMFPPRLRILGWSNLLLALAIAIACTAIGVGVGEFQVRSDESSLRKEVDQSKRTLLATRDRWWPGVGQIKCYRQE